VTLAIIWILFGIAAAITAGNKGRSGCAWFFVGVLLGPFGLLFALLLKPIDAANAVSTTTDVRKCPFCAETIKAEAIVCKHCGRDLPKAGALPIGPSPEELETKFKEWLAREHPLVVNPGPVELSLLRREFDALT